MYAVRSIIDGGDAVLFVRSFLRSLVSSFVRSFVYWFTSFVAFLAMSRGSLILLYYQISEPENGGIADSLTIFPVF